MDRSLLYSHGPNPFDLYIKVFYLWLDTIDLDPSNYRQTCSALEIGPSEQRQLVEQMLAKTADRPHEKQLFLSIKTACNLRLNRWSYRWEQPTDKTAPPENSLSSIGTADPPEKIIIPTSTDLSIWQSDDLDLTIRWSRSEQLILTIRTADPPHQNSWSSPSEQLILPISTSDPPYQNSWFSIRTADLPHQYSWPSPSEQLIFPIRTADPPHQTTGTPQQISWSSPSEQLILPISQLWSSPSEQLIRPIRTAKPPHQNSWSFPSVSSDPPHQNS